MVAFFYGIYRIQSKCKLCRETTTFAMKIFIIFLFHRPWMTSYTVFIEFNLNVTCVKRQYYYHISVQLFMDTFFYGIYRIQFKCKLCKDNNICYENFYHISVPEFMDAFFYGIYRIQFKCKLCKDNNFCYESFHHISVPEFIDAFFYGIYRIQFKM